VIDLRCADALAVVDSLPDGSVAFVHTDPPWIYAGGGPPMGLRRNRPNINGVARAYYSGLDEPTIAAHLIAAYRVAASDSYLAVWCTFPKLLEWLRQDLAPWEYVTGAAWGKTGGAWGVGFHFRGDAELLLLYRKGNPRPIDQASNLWLTEDAPGALWLADRGKHSEKPQVALRTLISMAAPVGGLVLDLYAGESASMARACQALNRTYIGAENDPARHAIAAARLSQQEMLVDVA